MTDIIELSRRLRAAGADPKLADAIVQSQSELVSGNAATKADLNEFRTELKAEVAAVRAELAQLRTEIRGEFTLLKWMLTGIGVPVALAAVKYLFKL